MLAYGKRLPRYESDDHTVVLRLFDETIDKPMATLVAKWHSQGIILGLDGLLLFYHLRRQPRLLLSEAASVLQVSASEAEVIAYRFCEQPYGLLEKKKDVDGTVSFQLSESVAAQLKRLSA